MMMADLSKCGKVVDIIPGRFTFIVLHSAGAFARLRKLANVTCYNIDDEYVYEPFASDFGPLNLGHTYRFCVKTKDLLQEANGTGKTLCFYCAPFLEAKANAAVLVGAFQVLVLGRTAEEACGLIGQTGPFCTFRDASSGPACFGLTVQSTVEGLAHAWRCGILDWKSFDLQEYEHHERVENGDSSWILPGKLLAFSGPAAVSEVFYGYQTKVPEDYWSYFRQAKITAVVRLNRPLYESSRFTAGGFRHYDLYFPDGSCPSEALIDRFLSIAEHEGALAIHCKAGLGRTGVLICCFMMKHFNFSARAALGYIRVCRPGSVIGPQQNFIIQQEARMHSLGVEMRKARHIASTAMQEKQTPGQQALAEKGPGAQQIDIRCNATSAAQPEAQPANDEQSKLKKEGSPPAQPSRYSRLSSYLGLKRLTIRTAAQGMPKLSMPGGKSMVARAVAPNGQPRKIPAALLAAGECGLKAYAADEDQPDSAKSDQWTINSCSMQDCQPLPLAPLAAGLQSGSRS